MFDKRFQQLKTAYKRKLELELEEKVSNNPNEFWNRIKNLGSKRNDTENFEVYDQNGEPTSDIDTVLTKWEQCTKDLFDHNNDPSFDNEFLEQKLDELKDMEKNNLSNHIAFLF